MKIKKALLGAALGVAAVGFLPSPAGAVECLQDKIPGTIDDDHIGRTCWDCGWVMVGGKAYTLFHCD